LRQFECDYATLGRIFIITLKQYQTLNKYII
jgi:hypothetical protein